MNKYIKKIMILILCLALILSVTGCPKSNVVPPPPPPETEIPPSNTSLGGIGYQNAEKNYAYAVIPDDYNSNEQILHFQSPNYVMKFNPSEGNISGFNSISYEEDYLVRQDFSKIAESETTFSASVEGTQYNVGSVQKIQNATGSVDNATNDATRFFRVIESGRYMNRTDILKMKFSGKTEWNGRLEIAAAQDTIGLNYQIFSSFTYNNVELSFNFVSAKYKTGKSMYENRVFAVEDSDKSGIAFILPADGSVSAAAVANGAKFTSTVNLTANKFCGFSVIAVPYTLGDYDNVKNVLARETISLTVNAESPLNLQNVSTKYDSSLAAAMIDGNITGADSYYTYNDASNRDTYDLFNITLKNDQDYAVRYPLAVVKNTSALNQDESHFGTYANFGMSGMTPILRSASGEPTGTPVQISKNWHSYGNSNIEQVARLYEGQWFAGYTEIIIPANSEVTYNYTIAYANWGGVAASSHSQLSLVGWGGYGVWEQLSLGSWGESICYNAQDNGSGAWIQDIRPFMVKNAHGALQEYNWSGNTGGTEFLRYDDGQPRSVNGIIQNYKSQGPNMTDISYLGKTSDNKISVDINHKLSRTDDITRNYYTINYTFLEDVTYQRMSFFQMSTERYLQNRFLKYAYGSGDSVIKDANIPTSNFPYFESQYAPQRESITGDNPWFLLYNYNNSNLGTMSEQDSALCLIVRDYKANINGTNYTSPNVNRLRLSSGQLSFELTAPQTDGSLIKAGSSVSMVLEFDVLPTSQTKYYGSSDYLLESKNLFNTSLAAVQQATGNNLTVNVSEGVLVSRYPLEVKCTDNSTAAQFTLKGGLGYTPLVFSGLQSAVGYKLQIKKDGSFVDVDQSVNGKDYWQCDYDYSTKTYRLVYNVKNSLGLDFNITNEYRLIKT